ncbi:sensor domain-containing diguanylate cyclase [Domibacillus indicus]|uniref:sensor domain-containing diguanylate cyclase n=1 Tax=Domibacillus indicus TaxID=1437523 RepID=UPI000697CAD0|nr:sensor domain-containing diguanylate cyclase [Domibacillus indicus]
MKLVSYTYNWMTTTLKGRFFTGIAALILFGGLLSILPLLIFVQEQREDDALMNLNEVLQMQQEVISEWQDELTRDINYLSELPEASWKEKDSFYEKLNLLGKNRTLFYDLFYADRSGDILYNTNAAAQTRKINVYDMPYFQEGMEWHTYTTGIRLIGESDTRSVIFSAPVTNENGRFGGILAGIVLADSLRYIVSDFAYGETGTVYLADKMGTVLSASSNEFPSSIKDTDIFQAALQEKQQTEPYDNADGIRSIGQYKWINHNEWVLISEVSMAEIEAPFYETLFFMGIILLLIFVMSYFFIRNLIQQMTGPIQALLEGTAILRKGGYGHRIDQNRMAHSAREFSELCSAYNDMADGLQKEHALRLQAEEDMRRTNEQLRRLSLSDGLTGIGNRRYFDEKLASLFQEASQAEQPLSLILIDVDFFKKYNDYYGHDAGDRALQLVAGAVEKTAQKYGLFAARYGGEELAVIVPPGSKADVREIGGELLASVGQLDILHEKAPAGRLSISAGAATLVPTPILSPRLLIQYADKALYQSKQQGRGRVTFTSL